MTSTNLFVEIDRRLVAIHAASSPTFPFSWVADAPIPVAVPVGTTVTLSQRSLRVDGKVLFGAPVRRTRVPLVPRHGRALLGTHRRLPGPLAATLVHRLEAAPLGGRDRVVAGMIGLGDGLTPTGDDIVIGILAGAAMTGDRALAHAVGRGVGASGPLVQRTSLVAAELLRHAIAGWFPDRIVEVARAAGSGSLALHAALDALESIGGSSGRDVLAGMSMVMRQDASEAA